MTKMAAVPVNDRISMVKTFTENLLLQNRMADDIENWYTTSGTRELTMITG